MNPPETIEIKTQSVGCDGGGALGHPRVFLTLGKDGKVVCPYCSRVYILSEDARQMAETH